MLDDALHAAVRGAHDAAVARRVGQRHGEQREPLALRRGDERAQRVGLRERHVPREHEHEAVVREQRRRLLHRVPGAQLRFLAHALQLELMVKIAINAHGTGASSFYFRSAVPRHHDHAPRREPRRLAQHVQQ